MTFSVGSRSGSSPAVIDKPETRQAGANPLLALGALLLSTCLLAGCQSADNSAALSADDPVRSAADAFSLQVAEQSIYRSARFDLSVVPDAESAVVSLKVSNASGLKAAYIDLAYDPEQWQPAGAEATELIAGDTETLLQLSITDLPGVVTHGQVLANWPERNGFSGDGVLATFRFVPAGTAAQADQYDGRSASMVPSSDKAAHYLNYNGKSSVFLWYYVNPGDYDQNGEVGITDLTPLGANFNDEGPFAVTDARAVIDGDGNDVINIADITPIGVNFGNTIDEFALYGASSPDEYPESNTGPNGGDAWQVATRGFDTAGGGGALRKYWQYLLDAPEIGDGHYWVRPVSGGAEGTPSQRLDYIQEWHSQVVYDFGMSLTQDQWISLAVVNGTPSLLVMQNNPELAGSTDIYYIDAVDALGDDWGLPQLVASDNAANHATPSLAEIDGKPAFSFYEDSIVNRLAYKRSEDATGNSWVASVSIDVANVVNNQLLEFDGKPVVVYTEGNNLYAAAALDSAGVTWLTPETLYSMATDSAGALGATALLGGVAAAVDDAVTGACVYCFAQIEESIITPGIPKQIFPGFTGANELIGLGVVGQAPFMVTKRDDTSLYYGHGGDKSGGDWTAPELCGLGGTKQEMAVGGAYGLPWACYYDPNNGLVRVGHATDTTGTQWFNISHAAGLTAAPGEGAIHLQMIEAGIHPALAFVASQEDKAYYAVYY